MRNLQGPGNFSVSGVQKVGDMLSNTFAILHPIRMFPAVRGTDVRVWNFRIRFERPSTKHSALLCTKQRRSSDGRSLV